MRLSLESRKVQEIIRLNNPQNKSSSNQTTLHYRYSHTINLADAWVNALISYRFLHTQHRERSIQLRLQHYLMPNVAAFLAIQDTHQIE
jgi:hypothetical protein